MRVVRLSVFETNSSSTHSMVIVTPEEFKQWKNGDIMKYRWEDKFVSREECEKIISEIKQDIAVKYKCSVEDIETYELISEYDEDIPLDFEQYDDAKDLEYDINHYTTKNGEDLVIICWFGNDY